MTILEHENADGVTAERHCSTCKCHVKSKNPVAPLSVDHGFDVFWVDYPRLHGITRGGKVEALKRWKDLDLEERRAAYRGARNMSRAISGGLDLLPPHASTFLNQRRWEDWQEPAPCEPQTPKRPSWVPPNAVYDFVRGQWVA